MKTMNWGNVFNHVVRLGFNTYEVRSAVKRSEDMASSARELAERLPAGGVYYRRGR